MKGKDAKPHIGIFGRRNNGKSSLINMLAGQDISIVSEIPGTTTDPVKKSIEILGIGPAIIIDTAGIDDMGELGKKRIAKTMQALKSIDLAILLITGNLLGTEEKTLIKNFNDYAIPFFIIHNKSDLVPLSDSLKQKIRTGFSCDVADVSTISRDQADEVIALIRKNLPETVYKITSLLGGMLSQGDVVLLITPIDSEAPEGRLILPQVQAIRDILDNDCIAVIVKEFEADAYISKMQPKPSLVITDSQVFLKANASVPKDIPLTSFSIMLAHHKGDFNNYVKGTPYLSKLKDHDRILILESCTHQVSCDDIGRVKLPRWISNFSGRKLDFEIVAGLNELPRNIREYAMVIQCGGCVITPKQIINRLKPAVDAGIPVTNYGMAIAYIHGIFKRAIAPFVKIDEDPMDYV